MATLVLFLYSPACTSYAGSGTTNLAIFEPRPARAADAPFATSLANAFHAAVVRQMDAWEVWGIELLTRESVTSAAVQILNTRAPQWTGDYSAGWKQLLNTNEMITYGAVGEIRPATGRKRSAGWTAEYQLVDFITGHTIATLRAEARTPAELGAALARQAVSALQIYLSEILKVEGRSVVLSFGPEAVSTGALLACYAHGHAGPHAKDYPMHGHRDEEDHLLGSVVYDRYRETSAPLLAHSHAPFSPRALIHSHLGSTTNSLAVVISVTNSLKQVVPKNPAELLRQAGLASEPPPFQWAFLSHQFDGMQTGQIRVEGFVQTRPYYHQFNAVGRIVSGFAIPGGFVQRTPSRARN